MDAGRLLLASDYAYNVKRGTNGAIVIDGYADRGGISYGLTDENVKGFIAGENDRDAALIIECDDVVIVAFRGTTPPKLSAIAEIAEHELLKPLLGRIEQFRESVLSEPIAPDEEKPLSPETLLTIKDWLVDVNAGLKKEPAGEVSDGEPFPGRIHSGFLRSIRDLWPELKPWLRQIYRRLPSDDRPIKPLWITGHSKGGALAILCAWLCATDLMIKPKGVRTFAAPRCADLEFKKNYEDLVTNTRRYEVLYDLVPHLPPEGIVLKAFEEVVGFFGEIGELFGSWLGDHLNDYAEIGMLVEARGVPLADGFRNIIGVVNVAASLTTFKFNWLVESHSLKRGSFYWNLCFDPAVERSRRPDTPPSASLENNDILTAQFPWKS